MGKRREGREAAVQFLYQCDLNPPETPQQGDEVWELLGATANVRQFAEELVKGVQQHREQIDETIRKYTENYELERIAAVDRNILRVAIYEMLHSDEVPPVVSINEAIEVAKRYGSEESGRFVNGILDRLKLDLARPARTAKPTAAQD